jgi:hypothetical protein
LYAPIQEEAAAGEWAAILSLEDNQEQPVEGITVADLNRVCAKLLCSNKIKSFQNLPSLVPQKLEKLTQLHGILLRK